MYDLDLEKNEEIKILDDEAKVIIDGKKTLGVSIVVTNKNIYFLDTPRGIDDIVLGNVIMNPINKKVVGKLFLEDINFKNTTDLGSLYNLKDNHSIEIISTKINNYLEDQSK
mgnify:FL=1